MAMRTRLHFDILPQPNDTACGPTCLQAVYRYYRDEIPLDRVINETPRLDSGGTLAVFLGCHALRRGYRATLYTYNVRVFDPTWFELPRRALMEKLSAQLPFRQKQRIVRASKGYLEFLKLGGAIRFEDLTPSLIRRHLKRYHPILTGLSATYLYRAMREYGPKDDEDDLRGDPVGHFVVLCGYDQRKREVLIADPMNPNPLVESRTYTLDMYRVINAILLGVLTYDANLLIIEPGGRRKRKLYAKLDRCQ